MFNDLSLHVQGVIAQKEAIFVRYPFSKSLKIHKLKGKWFGYWAFSVDYNRRIIFRWVEKDTALFVAVGDHSIYE
jgi:mRNA-degrading endonuclease YafQ of YafQ-DinJ toxin-antitoxin module